VSSRGRRRRNRAVSLEIGSIQDPALRKLAMGLYESCREHWDAMLFGPPGTFQQLMDRDRAAEKGTKK
jgi:hypothetical protein